MQANEGPQFKEEYDSLIANGTWKLTNLSKFRKNVKCKWLFRTKKDALDEIIRHKTQWIAKGYSQVAKVNFNKTFALVAKFITIRYILTIEVAMHELEGPSSGHKGNIV